MLVFTCSNCYYVCPTNTVNAPLIDFYTGRQVGDELCSTKCILYQKSNKLKFCINCCSTNMQKNCVLFFKFYPVVLVVRELSIINTCQTMTKNSQESASLDHISQPSASGILLLVSISIHHEMSSFYVSLDGRVYLQ